MPVRELFTLLSFPDDFFAMQQSASLSCSLNALRTRLDYVMRAWTVDNYEALMRFYVHVMPQLLKEERCGVYVLDSVR